MTLTKIALTVLGTIVMTAGTVLAVAEPTPDHLPETAAKAAGCPKCIAGGACGTAKCDLTASAVKSVAACTAKSASACGTTCGKTPIATTAVATEPVSIGSPETPCSAATCPSASCPSAACKNDQAAASATPACCKLAEVVTEAVSACVASTAAAATEGECPNGTCSAKTACTTGTCTAAGECPTAAASNKRRTVTFRFGFSTDGPIFQLTSGAAEEEANSKITPASAESTGAVSTEKCPCPAACDVAACAAGECGAACCDSKCCKDSCTVAATACDALSTCVTAACTTAACGAATCANTACTKADCSNGVCVSGVCAAGVCTSGTCPSGTCSTGTCSSLAGKTPCDEGCESLTSERLAGVATLSDDTVAACDCAECCCESCDCSTDTDCPAGKLCPIATRVQDFLQVQNLLEADGDRLHIRWAAPFLFQGTRPGMPLSRGDHSEFIKNYHSALFADAPADNAFNAPCPTDSVPGRVRLTHLPDLRFLPTGADFLAPANVLYTSFAAPAALPQPAERHASVAGRWTRQVGSCTVDATLEHGRLSGTWRDDSHAASIEFSGTCSVSEDGQVFGVIDEIDIVAEDDAMTARALATKLVDQPFALRFRAEGDELVVKDVRCAGLTAAGRSESPADQVAIFACGRFQRAE